MDNILACRICLNTDVNLFDMAQYNIKSLYENLSGCNPEFSNSNMFHACVYCTTLLKKFASFKSRCEQASQLLGFMKTQNIQDNSSQTKIHAIKTHISHPYKIQPIYNIDSTVPDIKAETIDTCSENEYDSKEFLPDFDFKSDSDDEPLSKKINKRKKDIKNHIKTETSDDSNRQPENLILESSDVLNEDLKIDNSKVIISKWEFDLVLLTKEQQLNEMLARKLTSNYINSRYKCEFCYKGFMTEVTYKNHMILHDKSMGPYTCPICKSRWSSARALAAHGTAHARRYECRVCAHTHTSRQRAKEHAMWHRGHRYPCACGAVFSRSTTYLTHVRARHGSHGAGAGGARCEVCARAFLSRTGLSMHKKKAHRNIDVMSSECGSCGAKFKNEDALKTHQRLATEGVCDTKQSWCETCGEGYSNEELYREHLVVHHSSTDNHTCTQCARTFVTERSLSVHYARAHGSARAAHSAVCELCGHVCSSVSALSAHQRTHTGEKPHACSLCHKRFSKQQLLQIHMRTHTGERPFQCARCPKAFKHKAALNRHDRVHTGLRPYRCGTCGKTFSQSNSMKQHAAAVHLKTPLYTRNKLHRLT